MNAAPISKKSPLSFEERFRAHAPRRSGAASRVATFIDKNRAKALGSSAADIGASSGTSDATVVRTIQSLGFDGLADLRQSLAASFDMPATPADNMRRSLADIGKSTGRAIDLVFDAHRKAFEALQSTKTREAITAAVSTLHPASRVVVFGIGPSAALAHYMTMLLSRNGRRARALDATGIALADQLLDLRKDDALLILAYGRSYREVATTFAEAYRLGLPTVLVTDTLDESLARRADVLIPARRGNANRVALHGATTVALEAVVLGLAASDNETAVAALDRLNDLREAVSGKRTDVP
jgi:DNA-binding MurR/RpiR family transcriptional regulator